MLKWMAGETGSKLKDSRAFLNVTEGLQRLYKEKLLPVEKEHDFHSFYSPELTDADFSYRPMVLLVGQYSTGKSTFIRHILGRDYPGLRIGPEPTTDKFVAVVHGPSDQVIPGNALVSDETLPFTQLGHFGNNFLSRFECAKLPCPVVESITLIDTPGVLSGEKQRLQRGYEFEAIVKWFSDRVDMILLLFDVSKMDISDEFRRVILALRGNDSKIHIILNKADRVTTPQLMRVYGAMMWSLGKVIDTPEVSRVFIGSFWDEPLANDEQRRLFESEENNLYTSLAVLPRSATIRKLNDLIKRARLAKVHAFVMDHLKRVTPTMFGKDMQKQRLLANLPAMYQQIAKEKNLPIGDFPDPKTLQEKLVTMDFTKFAKLDKRKIEVLDTMLNVDFPKLLRLMPDEANQIDSTVGGVKGVVGAEESPFAVLKVGGRTETSVFQSQWLVPPDVEDYRAEFVAIGPNHTGKISGQKAKSKLIESKLPSNALHKIWSLADVDKDGALTLYEYALARHFTKMKLDGQDIPAALPANMLPAGMSGPPAPPSLPTGGAAAAGTQDSSFRRPSKDSTATPVVAPPASEPGQISI
mmetsp:Transcript_52343/g.149221  ORF Transcript_52343/g.149221 Transcript_52343/m.149221 type:complete len:583 (-) Transcript_52343:402-2150(-)